MKRKVLLFLLIIVMLVTTVVACKKDPVGLAEGPETGTYYYDAGSEDYLITLNNADKFGFLVMGDNKSGTYELSGETLTLAFNKEEGKTEEQRQKLTATLKNGVITLTYENSQMRFLKVKDYTVSFESNEGSAIAARSVTNGKTVAKPNDPTRGGYAFLGWYVDSELETPFNFAEGITSNTKLYAKWVSALPGQNEFLVDFDLGYQVQNPATLPTVGSKLHDVYTPDSRTGYTFEGWWISTSNKEDELSFKWTEDMVFEQDTTLFALWQRATTGSKLPAPVVNVTSNSVRWNSVFGNSGYNLEISGPKGYELIKTVTSTREDIDFSQLPAGDYTIEVTAKAADVVNNSDTTVRHYQNKALARVSHFNVIGSTLLFNKIDNATKYTITVDCGDKLHNHDAFDNGNSTSYNFANCPMQTGGIKFVVRAEADGFATSESKEFTYNKVLSSVSNFYLVESTQTLLWEAVQNATTYIVSVKSGNSANEEVFDIGNKTSFNLKEFGMREGGIEIKVTPMTKGFNSPDASIYTYHKTTPAAPRNVSLNISRVNWTAVVGATSYSVRINDQIFTSDTNSYLLPESLVLAPNTDHLISVRANTANAYSLWSDPIAIRTSMYNTLTYANGVVSWKYVNDTYFYEVKVNDGTPFRVEGVNYANVTLDKAGINTITVRSNNDIIYSNEAIINVYAHAIHFYSNGGESVNTIYKAVSDPVGKLPAITRGGYDFNGWYTSVGGAVSNGLRFTDTTFAENGDITLYAYWTPKTINISYDGSEDTESITFGNPFKLNVPVSTDGRIFVGWYSEDEVKLTDDTGKSISTWQITEDATVYAGWRSALTYTLIQNDTQYSVKKAADLSLVTTLDIPSKYEGKDVTEIESEAFKGCTSLISVSIPDSIVSIGANAFQGCSNLTSINVAAGNTVFSSHEGVLYSTTQTETKTVVTLVSYPMGKSGNYTVKAGVTIIGDYAFDSNTRLTGITINKDVEVISNYAFQNCTNLITVTFENGGTEDLIISASAFKTCSNLAILTLPDNLTEIGDSAFIECKKLTTVTLPTGVTELNGSAFRDCSKLRSINLPNTITSLGTHIFFNCSVLSEIAIPVGIKSVPNNAFQNCTNLASVILPETIESIGNSAFEACGIAGIDLPKGLLTINQNAFKDNKSLMSLTLPSTLTSIGTKAFQNCLSLFDVTIPAEVTVIDTSVFDGCSSLMNVILNEGLKEILANAFKNCTSLTELAIPDSVTKIIASAFGGCSALEAFDVESPSFKSVNGIIFNDDQTVLIYCPLGKSGVFTIPDEVSEIADSAFAGNLGITKINIPESVVTIGASAFTKCEALTEVNIPSGLTELSNSLFSTCKALTTVTFGENSQLVTIGNSVFMNNDVLTNITIPSGVKSIGTQAFGNCYNLGDIVIPSGVTMLNMTFFQSTGVGNVTFAEGAQTEIGNMAFQRSGLISITIPIGVTKINASAFNSSPDFTAFNVHADNTAFCDVDGILYDKDKATLIKCPEGKTGTVTIPNTIKTISGAFNGCSGITEVTIPNSVTTLGSSTFLNCTALTTVTFAEGMTFTSIGGTAFSGCNSLESIVIPDSVTTITNTAFQNCWSLTGFVVSQANTNFSEVNGVLFNKDKTTLLSYPGGKEGTYDVPSSVTSIGNYAFVGCVGLTGITIPDAVTSIGTYAFQNCTSLTYVNLPNGITTIGNYTFDGCSALESITIPASITTIGTGTATTATYVFRNCISLTTVIFEEGSDLTTINGYAFNNCGFTSITLPESLKTIGNNAFRGSALREIIIPASVTSLGPSATASVFMDCLSLTKASFAEGSPITIFNNQIFSGCTSLSEVTNLPAKLTALGNFTFANTAITTIELPASLTAIGENTFLNCANLVDITIPSSVTSIGQKAFNNCTSLTKIDIPRDIIDIPNYAFAGAGLTEITLHRDIINIGDYAFQGCVDLVKVTFADRSRLTSIKNYVFEGCTSLTSIVIPNNVSSIGLYAFNGCTTLSQVTLPRSVKAIGNYAFAGCTDLKEITIPNSVIVIGNYAFSNCTGLTAVNLEEGSHLATIANYAFENCTSIISITLPNTVTTVGAYAFKGWTDTQNINITGYASAPNGWKANWNADCEAIINWDTV